MKLRELLASIPNLEIPDHEAIDSEVKGLSTNSQTCKPGDLFIGMPGTRVDGGEFWESAIASGACAALISPEAAQGSQVEPGNEKAKDNCIIPVTDMREACAQVAAAFYKYPASQMQLIGVTGTNGKTTTTHLIEFLLAQAQKQPALFGTLYARWAGFQQTAVHTTPFALELQQQLAQAVAAGCRQGIMEISSHALSQGRVLGCGFDVAVFTNLTQDHLDFHKEMEDYFAAKALLFSPTYLQGRAIINVDDEYGRRLSDRLQLAQLWRYSTHDASADLWTSDITYEPSGVKGILHTPVGEVPFRSPLVGEFNVGNLLAAVGATLHLGIDLNSTGEKLSQFPGVPGRMERVQITPEQEIMVIVDYAHTPDSLENMLRASRPFIPGKMICVFGCGGDRDRTKRPIMGKIAAELSDLPVVTSDNPRTEDPEKILQDILAGIPSGIDPVAIGDRATAIRTAILEAQPGDGVLIAGKGHEDYQILGTEKIHFDDREQARSALQMRIDRG
ncbi:MAG: UDP-N-acetylmuramoyl-L-alanyl-D-glutamate--2,6-diaminopimelate ligase [Hormoscilla sp. GM7CHS1pb]|nr:UDP-N-acetylmuramoyl-L-alanyl-D-glutamate--2,6-diaminopimelate ligase [Hormoscilla sp. GM7CHS1pb]